MSIPKQTQAEAHAALKHVGAPRIRCSACRANKTAVTGRIDARPESAPMVRKVKAEKLAAPSDLDKQLDAALEKDEAKVAAGPGPSEVLHPDPAVKNDTPKLPKKARGGKPTEAEKTAVPLLINTHGAPESAAVISQAGQDALGISRRDGETVKDAKIRAVIEHALGHSPSAPPKVTSAAEEAAGAPFPTPRPEDHDSSIPSPDEGAGDVTLAQVFERIPVPPGPRLVVALPLVIGPDDTPEVALEKGAVLAALQGRGRVEILSEVDRDPAGRPDDAKDVRTMTKFEGDKVEALRHFARVCEQTWRDYGVDHTALDREMTREKEVVDVAGNKIRHIGYKKEGLGVTLAQHLAKQRGRISGAKDPAALGEAVRKGEQVALDTALYLWATGAATGPMTQISLGNAAKAADRLADALEKMGKVVNAQQQRERADRLRVQAERAGKGEVVRMDDIRPNAAAIAEAKVGKSEAKPANPTGHCLCGCGAETRSNFKPGHDSKVHGLALKIARGQSVDHLPMGAAEYVQRSKWLTGAERAKFLAHHGLGDQP